MLMYQQLCTLCRAWLTERSPENEQKGVCVCVWKGGELGFTCVSIRAYSVRCVCVCVCVGFSFGGCTVMRTDKHVLAQGGRSAFKSQTCERLRLFAYSCCYASPHETGRGCFTVCE